jgi:hypothetical protein
VYLCYLKIHFLTSYWGCVLFVSQFHLPVAITLASQAAVSLEQPRVSVRVSDLLGQPLSAEPLSVTAESATRIGDEVVVLSKKKFEPTADDRQVT